MLSFGCAKGDLLSDRWTGERFAPLSRHAQNYITLLPAIVLKPPKGSQHSQSLHCNSLQPQVIVFSMMQAMEQETATQTMTKKQAAEFLGRSERSVNVYMQKGELPALQVKGVHGWEIAVKVADLERLKTSMQTPKAKTVFMPDGDAATHAKLHWMPSSAAMLQAQPIQQTTSLPQLWEDSVNRLVKALEPMAMQPSKSQAATVSIAEKLVLSMEEARRLSGVARDRLRAAIQADDLPAFKDVLGRGWKIRRADLAAWVAGLQR